MQIIINPQEVYSVSGYMKQKAEEYNQIIMKLQSQMHQMQSVWRGKDNQAFIDKLDAFGPQLKKITAVIEQYANYLNKSAAQYEQLQQERANAARTLAG